MIKKPLDKNREANRMRDLCVRSEQCSHDIMNRLRKRGLTAADAEQITATLISEGFVDDLRYACAFVRDKYRFSGWGRHKITSALYARHIPASLIEKALKEIDVRQYAAIAMRVMRTRLRMMPADMDNTEIRQRLYRFGITRGYESQLVTKIINSSALWASHND
ncbi:MAG: RecX family transcriptional regulator [Paramuribaculum sp.]|nr:RecX family transcriptional regulator [Paramuribaculum sp.]